MGLRLFLFLVGLFSLYRVHLIGMIGISEILICIMGPILYFKDFNQLRRDGFNTMANLMILCCVGCVISSWYNDTFFYNAIRGFAAPFVFFCSFIFTYHFLRKDFGALKWLVTGIALSNVLGLLGGGYGIEMETIFGTENEYWLTVLVAPIFSIPIFLFYERMPWFFSCAIVVAGGFYKILSTASGRSAALISFAAALLIWIGRKSAQKMGSIKRNFLTYLILSILSIYVAKTVYSQAAMSGALGEASQSKFYAQTGGKTSLVSILLGGRSEALVCILAALDRPFVGYGPWAIDTKGYADEVRSKYGVYDYEAEVRQQKALASLGMSKVRLIPTHSHIFGNWVWYGIFGLLMWAYVVHLIIKFYRNAPDAIPQWWGCLSLVLPSTLWHIFFSPFSSRVSIAVYICAILFALKFQKDSFNPDPRFWEEREKFLP